PSAAFSPNGIPKFPAGGWCRTGIMVGASAIQPLKYREEAYFRARVCTSSEGKPERIGIKHAYFQSIGAQRPQAAAVQDGESGVAGVSAEARGLHPRLHPDPQEAELGATQGGPRPADQWNRGYDLYSRGWAQPAGALDCADSWRPCEGSPGRALSR